MEKKRVLFISQEITPYLPESEMSVKSRYLPQGIQEKGREIRTFMPRYGSVNERRNQLHEVIRLSGMNLVINDADHPLIIKVASIQAARMQVYFIDNEDYFHRKNILKDSKGKEFDDNDERAVFFARGVLETVIKLRWAPDLIHCHGWLSSLVPLYIKKAYDDDPLFANSKVIYSVYNENFKKPLNSNVKQNVLIDGLTTKEISLLNEPSYENMSKLAIEYADGVIQGSESINPELSAYIADRNKLFLGYQPEETYIDAYDDFYEKVF
ncbi:glycogen/starch synthase [Gaoshiqia sp. Z1-71]|uniref:glycogen/starch synthase n=1 Tax=Gaoshiqia hydrogeniformans TaxID=3290090 RepID=UPI003BF79742